MTTIRASASLARSWSVLYLLVAIGWMGCARDPITGRRQLVLVSEAEEIAMGRQASADVDVSMGLYPDDALQTYVEGLGLELARRSERPELPWRFRIVDSPVVNAFALPGGYIYVTRGILAHMGSEAALVGVIGHEIGHVTARHSVEQMSKQQLVGLGVGLGGIFFPEVQQFGDVLGGSLGLLFLKFGRDAERESDRLGVRYSLTAGYDPTEMATFFAVLGRLSEGRASVPSWASTHPDPQDREQAILEQLRVERGALTDLEVGEEGYLSRIDGLVFGENPREGFMRDQRFIHPELRFQLDYPEGWRVQNTQTVVYAAPPDGGAALQLTLARAPEGTSPEAHARDFFRKNRLEFGTGERLRVGPFTAYRAPFRARTRNAEIYGQAGFIADGELLYELVGLTRPNAIRGYTPIFNAVIESFDRVTDDRDLEVQPSRLSLYTVPRSMTLANALEQAGMTEDDRDTLSIVNNLRLNETVAAGKRIKILERSP